MVTIYDVRFRKDGDTIPTDNQELARLDDTVSITVRRQRTETIGRLSRNTETTDLVKQTSAQ